MSIDESVRVIPQETISVPKAILPALLPLTDADSSRYEGMAGVLVEAHGAKCYAAATDGRSLLKVEWRQDVEDENASFKAIVPKQICRSPIFDNEAKYLPRVELTHDRETIGLRVDDKRVERFAKFQTRPIEGRFPNVDDLLTRYCDRPVRPFEADTRDVYEVNVDPRILGTLLRAFARAVTPDGNYGVKLRIALDGSMIVVEGASVEKEVTKAVGICLTRQSD